MLGPKTLRGFRLPAPARHRAVRVNTLAAVFWQTVACRSDAQPRRNKTQFKISKNNSPGFPRGKSRNWRNARFPSNKANNSAAQSEGGAECAVSDKQNKQFRCESQMGEGMTAFLTNKTNNSVAGEKAPEARQPAPGGRRISISIGPSFGLTYWMVRQVSPVFGEIQ